MTPTEDSSGTVRITATSHISESSSQEVQEVIDTVRPDVVALELDAPRLKSLRQQTDSQTGSLWEILTHPDVKFRGKLVLAVFSLVQSRANSAFGAGVLGVDMLSGYTEATNHGIPVSLVDQDMKKTFNNLSSQLTLTEIAKTVAYFLFSYLMLVWPWSSAAESATTTEDIEIPAILDTLEQTLPSLKRTLIDERNTHIADQTIAVAQEYDQIVLVIGAAHEPGVTEQLKRSDEITVRSTVTPAVTDSTQ